MTKDTQSREAGLNDPVVSDSSTCDLEAARNEEKKRPIETKKIIESRIKRTILLLSMFFCIFCTLFSNSGIGPSLGKIASELHDSRNMSWYVTGPTLTSVIFQLLGVRISDCLGRRRTELCSFLFFVSISMIAGFSVNNGMFITCRVLQGATGGVAQTNIAASLVDLFDMKDRMKYQPMVFMAFSASLIISPIVSGIYVDHFSWRWIFWTIPIISLPVLVALYLYLQIPIKPEQTMSKENLKTLLRRLDPIGCILISSGIAFFLMGMNMGSSSTIYTWSSPIVIGFLCGSVGFLAMFLIFEKIITPFPLFPSAVVLNKNLILCYIQQFSNGWQFSLFTVILFIEYQAVFDATTTEAALRLVPAAISNVVANFIGTRICHRLGNTKIINITGAVINTVASLLLLYVQNPSSSLADQTGILIMYQFGMGFSTQVSVLSFQIIIEKTHPQLVPAALSLARCLVFCGLTVSVSFSLSLLQYLMTTNMDKLLPMQPDIYEIIVSHGAQVNYSRVRGITSSIAKITIQRIYHKSIVCILYSYLAWNIISLICISFVKVPTLSKKTVEIKSEEN